MWPLMFSKSFTGCTAVLIDALDAGPLGSTLLITAAGGPARAGLLMLRSNASVLPGYLMFAGRGVADAVPFQSGRCSGRPAPMPA